MLKDDPNLDEKYRMPRVFGALPGPRNVPHDKRHLPDNQKTLIVSVAALTDADALAQLLPPGCELDGDPIINVSMIYMTHIGWLAGHGYNILKADFNIVFKGQDGTLRGGFTPVAWENLGDPIMTGREELGFPKLFAELHDPVMIGGDYRCLAAWRGFQFCAIETEGLAEAPSTPPKPAGDGTFLYRYIPKTGALGEADVACMVFAPSGGPYSAASSARRYTGKGRFKFTRARWEDVPFQYPVINALEALPIREFVGATVTIAQAGHPVGDGLFTPFVEVK